MSSARPAANVLVATARCVVCNKGFVKKNDLLRHTRTHTGEKPYHCPFCPHSSAQRGNLNLHILRQHSGQSYDHFD
ncbi:UNVERIFIED_CONTAM: hypothetical protein GTU68_005455 [Idotea baltica]|nr:hypothetical protein [Idotea baltica]